jgi:hypothetical protein
LNSLRKIAASIGVIFVALSSLLYTAPASAETTAGLTQDVYTYDSSSTPDRKTDYTLCSSTVVDTLNFDVGDGVVANCQQDFVLIHWTGYITMQFTGDTTFTSMADDGFYMTIGDQVVIDNWWLKGCGGGQGTSTFEAGVSQKIDVWWYEYGGGACNYLYYQDPQSGFTLVPNSVFTTEAVAVVVPPVVTPVDPNPPVVVPPVVLPPDPQPPVVVPPATPVDPPLDPVTPVDPTPTDPGQGPVVEPKPPVETPPSVPVVEVPVEKPTNEQTVTPEPPVTQVDPATIDPTTLSPTEVVQLQAAAKETLATSEEGSPEYNNALEQLAVAAKADDIVVDPELAAVPVIGAVAVGITNAINVLGNLGADMSPAHREKAKKEIVAAVVATGAAVNAVASANVA